MEKHPDAGWGLCSLAQDDAAHFPFSRSTRERRTDYHYLGPGLFHKAPLSSIIQEIGLSTEVGGFKPLRLAGDSETVAPLSHYRSHLVLLMPHGIVWYRLHADQESNYIKSPTLFMNSHSLTKPSHMII